jgi:type I restriction enzyme M protein
LRWIATPEKDTVTVTLEKRLWDAADQFHANSGLKPQECSGPTLGIIFSGFAERLRRRPSHGYELCSECIRP